MNLYTEGFFKGSFFILRSQRGKSWNIEFSFFTLLLISLLPFSNLFIFVYALRAACASS